MAGELGGCLEGIGRWWILGGCGGVQLGGLERLVGELVEGFAGELTFWRDFQGGVWGVGWFGMAVLAVFVGSFVAQLGDLEHWRLAVLAGGI